MYVFDEVSSYLIDAWQKSDDVSCQLKSGVLEESPDDIVGGRLLGQLGG